MLDLTQEKTMTPRLNIHREIKKAQDLLLWSMRHKIMEWHIYKNISPIMVQEEVQEEVRRELSFFMMTVILVEVREKARHDIH